MGTSITATLLSLHGWQPVALGFLVAAWVIAVVLLIGWLRHRSPGFQVEVMPAWGMLAMGVISLGSATSTVLGGVGWWAHLLCWVLGSALGIVSYVHYARLIFSGDAGAPTFSWGLPLVAPMVSATAGMQVVGMLIELSAPDVLRWLITAVCGLSFLASLGLAVPVFVRVYLLILGPGSRATRTGVFPPLSAPTAWIPLGVIGQSTAAAQLLSQQLGWQTVGIGYGFLALGVGVPLLGWALWQMYRVAFGRIAYSPTWWASTFPVGTCCLGSFLLALNSANPWLLMLSQVLLVMLLAHLTWAVAGLGWALRQQPGRVV